MGFQLLSPDFTRFVPCNIISSSSQVWPGGWRQCSPILLEQFIESYDWYLQPFLVLFCWQQFNMFLGSRLLSGKAKNEGLLRYTWGASLVMRANRTRRSWWILYLFWDSFKFVSASIRRLWARGINYNFPYRSSAKWSSNNIDGCSGMTVKGPEGVRIKARLNGDNLIEQFICKLCAYASGNRYVSQSVRWPYM